MRAIAFVKLLRYSFFDASSVDTLKDNDYIINSINNFSLSGNQLTLINVFDIKRVDQLQEVSEDKFPINKIVFVDPEDKPIIMCWRFENDICNPIIEAIQNYKD